MRGPPDRQGVHAFLTARYPVGGPSGTDTNFDHYGNPPPPNPNARLSHRGRSILPESAQLKWIQRHLDLFTEIPCSLHTNIVRTRDSWQLAGGGLAVTEGCEMSIWQCRVQR